MGLKVATRVVVGLIDLTIGLFALNRILSGDGKVFHYSVLIGASVHLARLLIKFLREDTDEF